MLLRRCADAFLGYSLGGDSPNSKDGAVEESS